MFCEYFTVKETDESWDKHLSNSYLDFAWFKISPRLRLAHIGHYMERWNSATQGYLK